MLLAGLSLGYFFNEQNEKQAKQIFSAFYHSASSSLQQLEQKLSKDATILGKDTELVSSLNLISEYATVDNYQAIIFDKEKWDITKLLSNYARAAQIDHLRIQDKNGWLVSYVDNEQAHLEEGIITFKNKQAVFNISSPFDKKIKTTPIHAMWRSLVKVNTTKRPAEIDYLAKDDNTIYLRSSYPIYRTLPDNKEIFIGQIYLSQHIDPEFIASISQHTALTHQVFLNKEQLIKHYPLLNNNALNDLNELNGAQYSTVKLIKTNYDYISIEKMPLKANNFFYVVSSLDRSIVSKQITETILVVIGVFIFSAIIIISIAIFFSRAAISRPVDSLLAYATKISDGEYKADEAHTGIAEFDALANTLRKTAVTIKNRESELRSANAEMESRVQQRTLDLRKTNEELSMEITRREQYEQQLTESKEMLQKIMDNIPQFIFWKDRKLNYLGCNKNFLIISGYDNVNQVIGKSDYDMPWTKDEADFYRECDDSVMQTNRAELQIQETLTDPDGNISYLNTNKVPLHDHNGNVIGVLGTFEDMTNRKKAELEVMQAKELAETANAAKSDFLSRMSHELRTPLNAILGFAQVLEWDPSHPLDTQQKQSIAEIMDAGKLLLDLINDILDLSKIETGVLSINIQPVQLNKLIIDALSLVKNYAQKENVTLLPLQTISDEIYVMADVVRLKQTMLNLFNNAIKYNKENGTVAVKIETLDEHTVKVLIQDTGLGIDKQYHDRVFTPFDRLGADTRAIDGTGIGLVICKQIIELMHGEIGFSSNKNLGTTFWFTLPVAEIDDMKKLNGAVTNDNSTDPEASALPARSILCVEDHEANRHLIERIINSQTPHKIFSVTNAERAIEALKEFTPDIILMDITLPGMNGTEATRLLKQHPDYKDIPIVAISANAMKDDIKQGLKSGFNDYITKPLDIPDFLKTLSKYLN